MAAHRMPRSRLRQQSSRGTKQSLSAKTFPLLTIRGPIPRLSGPMRQAVNQPLPNREVGRLLTADLYGPSLTPWTRPSRRTAFPHFGGSGSLCLIESSIVENISDTNVAIWHTKSHSLPPAHPDKLLSMN